MNDWGCKGSEWMKDGMRWGGQERDAPMHRTRKQAERLGGATPFTCISELHAHHQYTYNLVA